MIKSNLLITLLFIFVVIFSFSMIVIATGPLCQVYWMSPNDGIGEGGTSTITSWLNSMGYSANRIQDYTATNIRSTMDDDAVFAIVSHGNAGRVYCENSTTISGNIVMNDNNNYSLPAIYTTGSFSKMRFAYWGSCFSSATDSTYGNLITRSVSFGADASLGYENSVSDECATFFEKNLFYYLKVQATIYGAAEQAKADTYFNFGYYGNVNTYEIAGNSSSKIYPVGYGS